MKVSVRLFPLLLVVLAGCASGVAHAAELPTDRYDAVLKKYASPRGFDYAGLKADAAATADLSAYVEALAGMSEKAPLADWLNAYNALVVHSVLTRMPVKSVMKVPGFFKKIPHQVAGKKRTLDDIEHKVVRARFEDARVHFALNCGAKSCPTLHGRAFRQKTVDSVLAKLTRAALGSATHLRRQGDTLHATALVFWFKDDFVRDGGGSVLGFLRKYAPKAAEGSPQLKELPYDWQLNQK